MISPKVKTWLAYLYPHAWRQRYGEEFSSLLEQSVNSPLDVVDVFLGAMDAHLQLLSGEKLTWRTMNMLNKNRTTILVVFSAFIGYVIAGFALVGLADDSPIIPAMQSNTLYIISWILIHIGALAAGLAVVVGGLPLAITVIRGTFKTQKHNLGWLLVPVTAFVIFMAYLLVVFLEATGRISIPGVVPVVSPGPFPPGNRLLLGGLMFTFVFGAILSTWAVWKIVSRMEAEEESFQIGNLKRTIQVYQFAIKPAMVAVAAMLLVLVATISWGWLAFSTLPQVFSGNYGPWETSTRLWYYGILALMAICSFASALSLQRYQKAKTAA